MLITLKLVDSLTDRQEKLLELVVRRHTETAEPVGSSWLAEELKVSPATARNEMAALEAEGYLAQPHTSAGRIPTERGYRHFVSRMLRPRAAPEEASVSLKEASEPEEPAERLRRIAKTLAEHAQETSLVGFGPRDVYYTGITNLFSKPEFTEAARVTTMSKVLDHLDEVMERVFEDVESDIEIRVGKYCPFGQTCSVLMTRVPYGETEGIIALLGPMRMDYDGAYGLLREAVKILKET